MTLFKDLVDRPRGKTALIIALKHCPYSDRAESMFRQAKYPYQRIDIDTLSQSSGVSKASFKQMMRQAMGKDTFPQIFVNQRYVGDSQKVESLYATGQIHKLANY